MENNTSKSNSDSNHWFVGVYSLSRQEAERMKNHGQYIAITGYGVLGIDEDIEDSLLFSVVKSIRIRGKVICRKTIKEHYGIK